LYTGITTDLKRRFQEHKEGKGGKYTSAKGVKKMVYSEPQKNRSSASKREAEIKSWTKTKKKTLINSKI
jgi:putative endonuclease